MIVKFAGHEVPRSPFPVTVEGFAGDPAKVTACGPGVKNGGVVAGMATHFTINTKGKTARQFFFCICCCGIK